MGLNTGLFDSGGGGGGGQDVAPEAPAPPAAGAPPEAFPDVHATAFAAASLAAAVAYSGASAAAEKTGRVTRTVVRRVTVDFPHTAASAAVNPELLQCRVDPNIWLAKKVGADGTETLVGNPKSAVLLSTRIVRASPGLVPYAVKVCNGTTGRPIFGHSSAYARSGKTAAYILYAGSGEIAVDHQLLEAPTRDDIHELIHCYGPNAEEKFGEGIEKLKDDPNHSYVQAGCKMGRYITKNAAALKLGDVSRLLVRDNRYLLVPNVTIEQCAEHIHRECALLKRADLTDLVVEIERADADTPDQAVGLVHDVHNKAIVERMLNQQVCPKIELEFEYTMEGLGATKTDAKTS